MTYVYFLRSASHSDKTYVGHTDDVHRRLAAHNAGDSSFSSRFRPWKPILFIGVPDEKKALALERYLKSGSGHAFAHRHLW